MVALLVLERTQGLIDVLLIILVVLVVVVLFRFIRRR